MSLMMRDGAFAFMALFGEARQAERVNVLLIWLHSFITGNRGRHYTREHVCSHRVLVSEVPGSVYLRS